MYSVYALCDPRTNEVHYIGCTLDVGRRFSNHMSDKKGNVAKRAWIDELKNLGLLPKLLILEEGLRELDAFVREAYWIKQYTEKGAPLTNAYRVDPDKVKKRGRIQSIYHVYSQEQYDYMVSLGRKVILRKFRG